MIYILKNLNLQELSNPYVTEHLQFIPELPSQTDKVNRFAQSKKWREDLDRDIRVQMVDSINGHFYLFEPVQLQSKHIVVPIFFYQEGTQTLAKCVPTCQRYQKDSQGQPHIQVQFESVQDFDSPSATSINVREFWRVFNAIELRKDTLMKTYCGDFMYGEGFLLSPLNLDTSTHI